VTAQLDIFKPFLKKNPPLRITGVLKGKKTGDYFDFRLKYDASSDTLTGSHLPFNNRERVMFTNKEKTLFIDYISDYTGTSPKPKPVELATEHPALLKNLDLKTVNPTNLIKADGHIVEPQMFLGQSGYYDPKSPDTGYQPHRISSLHRTTASGAANFIRNNLS